ncbi:hypothetical protein [Microbacterium dextranolyticum]|uniref:Uncharacterized protein n=1 Tax=Microbacterium dextranolyticum TaxID=36806 RepID=A0A9W6HN95_9MICO|nr:hypothetical protein [Microbacterium dextranolyticum]MBM7462928.1 hypothetical protein [Microbacterium dextranolyticum]GLJ95967.1 hypothetical protein GCM10017591_20300 [Microbacterium dextranolyticum]
MNEETTAALWWAEAIVRDEWKEAQAEHRAWRQSVGAPAPAACIAEGLAADWFCEVA